MAWDFKPGMKVVRIRDADQSNTTRADARLVQFPITGQVYTVREVIAFKGEPCLRLEEIRNPKLQYRNEFGEIAFRATRFRPVRTTDISALEAHLNTLPVRIKTEA